MELKDGKGYTKNLPVDLPAEKKDQPAERKDQPAEKKDPPAENEKKLHSSKIVKVLS